MDEYQRNLEKALRFLSYRSRSEKEVRDNLIKPRLTKNGLVKPDVSSETIEKVITWLKEQRFLNDEEFARLWIESRARAKPKSMYVLKMELRKKGVSREVIDKVVENPETVAGTDRERAKKLAMKKLPKYKHLSRHEIYQKLGGVLARNGFDWETSKASIDDLLSLEYNKQ